MSPERRSGMRVRAWVRLIAALALIAAATFASLIGLRVRADEVPRDMPQITGIPVPGGRGPILVPVDEREHPSPGTRQLD